MNTPIHFSVQPKAMRVKIPTLGVALKVLWFVNACVKQFSVLTASSEVK